MAFAIYGLFIEPARLELRRVTVRIPDLPEALDEFTICHISDTHFGRYGNLERKLARAISGLEVDMAVVTGDLARKRKNLATFERVFEGFRPRYGAYAVPGNNDYELQISKAELTGRLNALGIRMLMNEHASLSIHDAEMQIIGVDDPYLEKDNMQSACSGLPEGGFRVLLAHSPDILMRMNGCSADLIFAGHTHGGQIKLPWIGSLWLHCRYPLGISDGYFSPKRLARVLGPDWPPMHMHVSRGIGGSGIRARILCPPEVSVITLQREFHDDADVV
ncbi:MAG: metallophosphoesterase [Armatimonadota bacterium]